MSNATHERKNAALYGLIVGLTLAACLALAAACGCDGRQTGAVMLAGGLVASVLVGVAL